MTLSIEKVLDLNKWDIELSKSKSNSIFLKSFYTKGISDHIEYFFIKKGDNIKAGFMIISDGRGNIIENIYLIHTGIFFKEDLKLKLSSKNFQIFEITEIYKNFLNENFKNIFISLTPEVTDLRPFQWHNYHNQNKPKYSIEIKYTSYLNLKNFKLDEFQKSLIYSNLNENRRRNILAGERNGLEFINDSISNFKNYYLEYFKKQKINLSSEEKKHFEIILNNLSRQKKIEIVTSKVKNNLEYSIALSWDDKKSYYLFGAPIENTENYSATCTFWEGIKRMSEKQVEIFDFEGINSPNRGKYKQSFGGKLVPYYVLNYKKDFK